MTIKITNINNKKQYIYLTKIAKKKIKQLLNKKKNYKYHFRIFILGGGCNGFQYCTILDNKIKTIDHFFKKKKINIIIDRISLKYLIGSIVDYQNSIESSKFIIKIPNIKNKCSCGISFDI